MNTEKKTQEKKLTIDEIHQISIRMHDSIQNLKEQIEIIRKSFYSKRASLEEKLAATIADEVIISVDTAPIDTTIINAKTEQNESSLLKK